MVFCVFFSSAIFFVVILITSRLMQHNITNYSIGRDLWESCRIFSIVFQQWGWKTCGGAGIWESSLQVISRCVWSFWMASCVACRSMSADAWTHLFRNNVPTVSALTKSSSLAASFHVGSSVGIGWGNHLWALICKGLCTVYYAVRHWLIVGFAHVCWSCHGKMSFFKIAIFTSCLVASCSQNCEWSSWVDGNSA